MVLVEGMTETIATKADQALDIRVLRWNSRWAEDLLDADYVYLPVSVVPASNRGHIARSNDRCGATDKLVARLPRSLACSPPRRGCCGSARTFLWRRLQRLDVEGLLINELLQPPVLLLQRLQPAHFAELRLPALQRLAANPVTERKLGSAHQARRLLGQDRDDLLVGKFALFNAFGCSACRDRP